MNKHIWHRRVLIIVCASLVIGLGGALSPVFAQTPTPTEDADTVHGAQLYTRIAEKTLPCANVTDDQFDQIGDYVMQQMMGNAHDTMDQMMTARFGDTGEKNMHIAMGKRATGCATTDETANGQFGMMGASMMGNTWTDTSKGLFSTMNTKVSPRQFFPSIWIIACFVLWIAFLVFLILGCVYFWKEIQRKK